MKMSGKALFACSKCYSRHPFEGLSSGTQLCKNCRSSASIIKCTYCRSEFHSMSKSQTMCKKCEHNVSKYGKPSPCECCKIVAAFGGPKCMRCASYEAKYGPPVQCEECKLRSAFDKRDENKKVNGKILCWLCACAYKRAVLKAQSEGRIPSKKRPYEKLYRENPSVFSKKSTRNDFGKNNTTSTCVSASAMNTPSLDLPEKIIRSNPCSGNSGLGVSLTSAPAMITIDPNSADHVVAITTLKDRIATLEKRLHQKDKELLEKDKLLTEIKGKNYEKEVEMRNKLKEVERLHEMKVENLNRKVASLLKEIAGLKKRNKKPSDKEREKQRNRENIPLKDDVLIIHNISDSRDREPKDKQEEKTNNNRDNTKKEKKSTDVKTNKDENGKSKQIEDEDDHFDDKESECSRSNSNSSVQSTYHSQTQSDFRSRSNSRDTNH